jgi:hypothetical protein
MLRLLIDLMQYLPHHASHTITETLTETDLQDILLLIGTVTAVRSPPGWSVVASASDPMPPNPISMLAVLVGGF